MLTQHGSNVPRTRNGVVTVPLLPIIATSRYLLALQHHTQLTRPLSHTEGLWKGWIMLRDTGSVSLTDIVHGVYTRSL